MQARAWVNSLNVETEELYEKTGKRIIGGSFNSLSIGWMQLIRHIKGNAGGVRRDNGCPGGNRKTRRGWTERRTARGVVGEPEADR